MKARLKYGSLFAVICVASLFSHAQNLYGFTSLDYDEGSNLLIADCETVADYTANAYYDVELSCSLTNDGGTEVAYGSGSDQSEAGQIEIVLYASAEADRSYTVRGTHFGIIYYYDWDSSCGNGRSCYTYYDFFNLMSFSGQNIDASNWWDFYMPGPQQTTNQQHLRAGNTHAQKTPPRPSVLKVKSWCPGGKGATLEYWLLNNSGGRSQQG